MVRAVRPAPPIFSTPINPPSPSRSHPPGPAILKFLRNIAFGRVAHDAESILALCSRKLDGNLRCNLLEPRAEGSKTRDESLQGRSARFRVRRIFENLKSQHSTFESGWKWSVCLRYVFEVWTFVSTLFERLEVTLLLLHFTFSMKH